MLDHLFIEPETDENSPGFTDEDSVLDDEDKSEAMNINGEGGNSQPQKKTVAQIMRDKKKQTQLTLQWWVHCVKWYLVHGLSLVH